MIILPLSIENRCFGYKSLSFLLLKEIVSYSHVVEELESDRPAQDSSRIPTMCLQCNQERINTMLQPCNDVCVCLNCEKDIKEQNRACPYCNKPVNDYIFLSICLFQEVFDRSQSYSNLLTLNFVCTHYYFIEGIHVIVLEYTVTYSLM